MKLGKVMKNWRFFISCFGGVNVEYLRDIAAFLASGSGVSIDFVLDVWGISSSVSFLSSLGNVVPSEFSSYAS